jgi:hypothetical protein
VLFPAIPLVIDKGIGLDVIQRYLSELT